MRKRVKISSLHSYMFLHSMGNIGKGSWKRTMSLKAVCKLGGVHALNKKCTAVRNAELNKHKKTCQNHLSWGKCKVQPQWGTRMAKFKRTNNIKSWWRCRGNGTLIHCRWQCKWIWPLWGNVWSYLLKLKYLSSSTPGHVHSQNEYILHKHTCMKMFQVVLFIIDKNWKQAKCTKCRMNKLQCVHTMK